MSYIRYVAVMEITLALALWVVGLGGVAAGWPLIREYLYFFAWYPYILFLDGLLLRLRGESWLVHHPRDLLRMGFWSVTVWLIFEAVNLVLKNWGYIGMIPVWWLRWPGYAVAFATVLPGVLLTGEALAALGVWKKVRGRPRHLGAWQPLSLIAGTALLVLPLVFPHHAFPLIWLAFIFLLDPFVELLGGKSLIARFAAGERQEHLCLLTGGLLCGLWWESWNALATAKWVYTLPVLNYWKIFEMPLLGYLGFIPFALECAVMYNFFKALEERVLTTPQRRRYAFLCHGAFWLAMFVAMDIGTVIAYHY